jgi:hypothetical protein
MVTVLYRGADPVVVFVDSKREAMDLWVWARDRFPEHADRCGVSHSLRSADDRAITGRLFSNGDLDVVICTSVMEMVKLYIFELQFCCKYLRLILFHINTYYLPITSPTHDLYIGN